MARSPEGADSVRRSGGLPRYQQIALIVESKIAARDWSAGERIPSEAELAEQFSVSVMTVRQALALVVEKGILDRRHGRGTFVSAAAHDFQATEAHLNASLAEVAAEVMQLEVRPIDLTPARGPLWAMAALGLEEGASAVRARRIRVSASGPVVYTVSYLPEAWGSKLSMDDLHVPSLVSWVEQKQGSRFLSATQTIEAVIADPESATFLETDAGAPLLLVQRIYHLPSGEAGFLTVARYPSTMFRYRVHLTRDGSSPDEWRVDGTNERSA